jgi:hypothetical protein
MAGEGDGDDGGGDDGGHDDDDEARGCAATPTRR